MDSIRAISTISTPIPARAINTPPSHNAYPQYCNGLRGMMRRHGADSKRSAETCSKDKQKRSGAPEGPALHLYGSAVHRSAAPCSPTGFPRSTIGARRLSFRVRNGSGRAPPAMAADRWAALRPPRGGYVCPGGPSCPGGRTARRWTFDPASEPTGSIARHPSLARRHPRRYEMLG